MRRCECRNGCNNCKKGHCSVVDRHANTGQRRQGALAQAFSAKRAIGFTAVSIDAVLEVTPLTIDPSVALGADIYTNTIHATAALATEWATARSYMASASNPRTAGPTESANPFNPTIGN